MKAPLLPMLLAGVTMFVGGCAVVAVDDSYGIYYEVPDVSVAPPLPNYEYTGTPPVVGHLWIGGYWEWVGSRYNWVPGRREAARTG